MGHELAGVFPAGTQAEAVDDVVQPGFQELEELGPGDFLGPRRRLKVVLELPLERPVKSAGPLLFPEADRKIGRLSPARAVHARGRRVLGHGALVGVALLPFEVELHTLPAT